FSDTDVVLVPLLHAARKTAVRATAAVRRRGRMSRRTYYPRRSGVAVTPGCHDRRMCRICDGATREQLNEEAALEISVYGYSLQGVVDPEHSPWVYAVGLLDSAGHPELIIPGVDPEESAPILSRVADM